MSDCKQIEGKTEKTDRKIEKSWDLNKILGVINKITRPQNYRPKLALKKCGVFLNTLLTLFAYCILHTAN